MEELRSVTAQKWVEMRCWVVSRVGRSRSTLVRVERSAPAGNDDRGQESGIRRPETESSTACPRRKPKRRQGGAARTIGSPRAAATPRGPFPFAATLLIRSLPSRSSVFIISKKKLPEPRYSSFALFTPANESFASLSSTYVS
jgi:hypothetical protein